MFSLFQNILPKLYLTVAVGLSLTACSASTTPQVVSNTSNQSKSTQFLGAKSLSPNEDGTWTLFWQPALGFSNVYYRVFQRQVNESFDYDRPIATTTVSNYTTKDLRLIGNTCYVVRFSQPGNESDKNTTEICTGHKPYTFEGVSSIQSMRDGTYMLRWTPPPFSGARFSILQRKSPKATLDYVGETTQNFFQTGAISLNDRKCFVVRYNIPGFPVDKNEKEACTQQTEGELIFAGLKSLSSPDNGKLLIEWEALEAPNVAGYYVYLGSEFRPNMRHLKISDPKLNSALLADLQHAVVYTIGVRAFDKFGREDQNTTVMSYELKNHITNIRSVNINVKSRNALGKPTTVECIADYEDTDTWQTLYPTAWIRNNKRDNLGVVERALVKGSAGQKIFSYTLVGDDQRADEIYCELQVNDGFDDTTIHQSSKLVIPDTPVVATGLNLSTTENTVLDIAITRGEGLGYLDADRDNARSVIFSTEKGLVVSDPPFVCIEGTCTGQFKPDKDFFTDLGSASPEYASIRYQVVAGDSTSNMGEIRIVVRPVPRALGFDFIAQQDEDRSGSIARATEVNSQDQVVKFEAYRHVLNRPATFLYVRQPLYQQDTNGVVKLPPGIVENPSLGIGCRATVVSGWTKAGFECGIPCTNGECPFVFRGDNSYYGPSSFDYAVVADGIQSNYASARVSILPNLRAIGFNGLTVEGQSYQIKMTENVGFKGAQNDLQIDRIDIVRTDGNEAAMPVFSESSPGEWTATYIPNVGFNGTAEFEYQLKATKDGRSIESNVGKASIRFYPLPVATGLSLQGIQDTPRTVTVKIGLPNAKAGYAHGDSAKASRLFIENIDLSKGYIENFSASINSGDIPCVNGQCTFTYTSASGYYDPIDASVFTKMSYWVQMPVPDDVVNNSGVVLDAFLQDANNRIMRSNSADLAIQLRPVPVASNLSYAVKEASATRPTSVEIVVSPVGSPAQYLHPFNYKATAANVVANPSFGAISLFSCNPDDGVCRANYSPSVGQTGQLAPDISWNVTVTDPYYLLDSGRVASLNKKISIDVRPVPKVTGLALAVAENTSFAPSTKDFVVSLGNGYTHVSNLLANTLDVSEKNGTNGTFTPSTCALGVCSATYTPNIDTYGLRKFNYRVWTTDAILGPIDSEYGEITLEVRPRPRAIDLGSEGDPSSWTQVVENTQKTISVSLGANYTHAYNTKANQIEVLSYYPANGIQPTGTCDGLGVCRITYDPPTNYEGPAWIEYRVSLLDAVLQDNLTSNRAKIYLDVYPKPRATGRKLFVLAEQTREIKLELKTGRVLDEDNEPSLLLRKGYAHRRDDKATVVTTSDLTRGTLSQFSCGPNSCVAAYVAPTFQSNVIDSFKYKVTVGGIESPLPADYQIEVRPTATAKNLSKHTLENLAFAIDLRAGETEAYTHPIGEKATRVEILSSTNGTATVNDLAPSNTEKNCDDQGRCQINFDPTRDYWTPDGGENKAFITYRVWTFDPTMGVEVASNTARIDVNVRPIPRAVGMATAAIQGNQPQIVMAPGLLTGFTYVKPDGSSITKVKIFNVQKGATSKNEYSCSLSSCEAIVFVAAIDDQGVAYYGNLARFDYTIVVNDPVAGSIESAPNSVQIDFRPRPVAQSVHIKFWQQSDKQLSVEPGNGYVHPYYETSPGQYRATELKVITSPNATVGDILAPGFSCSSVSPFNCTATFRPNPSYYYTALGGYPQIKFTVSIQDPVLGKIDSNQSNITLEVKPIIINLGKSVRGVQTAPKIVTLAPGDGYSYPNSFDSVPPQVIVIPGTINRGTIPAGGELTCTKPEGLCTGTLNPVDATVTGLASFDYKLILNDPELGIKESATKTYSVDFYPKPKSVDFLKTFGKNFKGSEGSGSIISLLPGSWPTGAYCFASMHSVSGIDPAYRHELCDVSAEISIISATNGTFNGMTKFPYVEAEKKWAATFQPAPENELWPGYGLASFRYQVKLMPEVLKDLTLTQAESDALLSQVSTAEVEFIPKPYATGVSLKASNLAWDYIYGVQGRNLPFTVSRCDTPATRTTCFLGYVHGYNQPANDIEFRNWSANLSQYSAATCDALGVCNTTLQINNSFYTTDTNYATFEYRVKVSNDWSSWVGQNVNVYPTPVADSRSSPGIEGQEITLVIDANQGYTHPKGAKAIKIMVVNAPDLAKGGLVNPSDPTKILTSSAEDVEKAFSCDPNGRCVATYRPAAGNGDDNLFYFRVQVAGPPGMPDAQAAQLISDVTRYDIRIFPKPRVQTTEVVAVEGTPTPFAISLGSGYTHRSSKLATRLSLLNGDRDSSGKIVVNNGDIRGSISGGISCDSGDTSCYLACSSGTCTGFFTGLAGVYSNTIGQTPEACAAGGALCPDINFNVVVKDTGGTELEASADVPAPIRFNVRPKPTVPPLPISLKQVEGEPIIITMTKPAYYGHPFYNASKITDLATTNGDLSASNFTCDTVSGRCEATFTPKASWIPGGSNIYGTIDYKVVVTDPTNRTSGPGTVGDIKSNAQGQVRIEYRPKPVAAGLSFAMLEDESQVGFRTVTIGPSSGYSHAYGLKATKIQILKDSTLQRVSIGNGTCSGTSCEIPCTSDGQCSVELQPDPNYYGPGQFSFHITVLDDAFSPARELKTNTPGIVSIDIRPQPEAHNLAWNSKAGDPVAIVLANAANTGYQHPVHDYAASKVSIVTAPTAGTLSANITCETTPGATNYRQCLGTYSPTGATYGTDSLTYKLAVYDQVLGRDIWSDHKTLTFRVRPLPIATGFATAWTTKENTPRDLVLQLGAVETDKLGYWYPNNQAPDYDVHPYAILITQNPNVTKGSLSASGFACTSGTTSPKGCQTTFTPAVNQYGSTSFKYKVQIQDQYVGLVTSNEQPINIDVRPIIRASDISYTTNTSFRTIQDQDLVWQISNGATTGYTYPTDATYNTVRDTLAIATYDRPSDGGGTILPGASCVGASGICSGTFRPTPGFFNTGTSNAAKFDFEVSVLDASLPLPMQTITSLRKTVSIDVYPKPVANNITRYTVEGQAISVAIKRGTGLGFTHARNHNPIGITVSGSNAIATLDGSHFTCTTDTCTATVTPVGYSASALAADAASFNYYVDVRETGTNPRTARSDNTGKATITVYPRSVPSFAVATQIIAFEGEAASISLKKGVDIGYTHPWNDSAVGVTVENKSTGSVVSTFTCTSGECSATFTPPLGTSASSYGDSKGWIDYKTKTTYGNLSPADVLSSTTARANFKIRAVPRVDTTWTKSGFIENTDFNFDIVRGSGYQYLDDTAYTDATIKIAYRNPSRVACKAPISCVATNEYTCDQNGNKTCRVGLTPEANWNRVDGMASLEYKIGVVDSVAGVTKWSPWSKANFPLIPRPYNPTPSGENKLIFSDGIQGSPYNFSVSLSNGYTHEEGLFAKRMWLYSAGKTNLSSPITDSSATCNATGLCSLSIAPITTAFGAVSARDQNGTTNGSWGWSALQYSVEHEIDGVVVTPPSSQPKGNAFVYFRPIPEKDDLNFVNAIENEEFTIQVKNKSGSCTSNCGYVFPDEFSLAGVTQHYADTIAVTAPTGGATLTQASSCNSATGVCTVKVKRTDAGPVTFTTKVTVNGVTQSVASPVSVYFQARARTSNLTASTTEGTPAVIEIKRGAGYTQLDNLNAGSVLITNITNAEGGKIYWMDAVDGTPTECSTSGSAKLCSCVGDKCIIRFVPRAWSSGEGVLTGSFKFQTRDASLKEADGVTPLSALNVSTVTINMNPRIVTNSRSYPAGVNEGEEGVVKTVEIKEGAGGTNIGGFDHVFDHRIDFIKVTTVTGATVSGLNSWVACSGGVCNVPLTPLADAAFVTNGSFTYHLKDLNGYESHVAGTASVYFYPRPKASSRSIVVAKNSSSNVLSIASGAGYSHALNTPASTWGRPTSPTETPAGTLSGWTCDAAGNCTVNFTPNPDAYTDSATPTKFDYRVGVTAPHGTVYSDAPHGLFSIDIFPRPVATAATKELRWVEGIGDITKPAGQQMRITIQKNVDYTHDRGSNPVKIIATNVTGGTLSPFICGSSACWADFTPTATSPDPTTAAASFKLQTVVEDAVKYLAYPTDPVTYSIVIMPKPLAKAFTVQTIQGETHDFNMGSVANTTSTPKTFDSLDAPWGMGYTAPANIEITEQPSQSGSPTGTLSLSTCTSGNCSVRFVPINQLIAGNSTFKYRVRMTHPSDPTKFDAYSAEETGTINQAYAYTVTGRLFEKQQILGADGVIPVTEIPLAIELNNGYSKLTGYPLIQDLQITSTLSSAQGTIVDATMNNGVWSAKFRSAPFWFGEVSLNYRVCKTGCTLTDDVKSLSSTSPATAMRIKVIPNNNPPTACNKSLIVFQNQAKRVSMERDNTSCGNGKWYGDLDNDDVNKVRFLGVSDTTSWGTFAGISVANGGDGTTCSTSGSDVICSCATAACTWQWTPPSGAVNVDKIINWSIETYSSVIKANFASQTNGQITFSIKSPLQPVAENLTFTSVEDTNLTVSLGPSEGYLTPTEINAAYAPLPDGYPMVPSDVIIDSHTATFRTVDATGCDISTGICTIIVSPQWDVVGTGTITYRIKANGLWSAQKTITVTYTSVDDAPNTYGSDERDLVLYRRLWFDTNPYLQDTRSMGTFYVGGVGSPVTVTLKPYLNASVGDNPMRAGFPNSGTWDWWGYGYYDVDGDKAIKVRIDPATLVGGTISYAAGKSASDAMTCDANGACSFVMVPDGTRVENWMTVNYYVTTKRGTVEKEQPVASSLAIWVSQGDDTPFTNYHLPVQNQENPDINMANYDENYIIGRAMSKNFVLRNGTDALAAWQSNSWRGRPWYNSAFPNTELATNIEVGNGANGAPAPSGGSVDGISCNGGTCTGSFSSLTSYDTYPTTASFWYRVVSGQNYSYGYYNFGNNIVAKSPWKKVTFKVALNAPGSSCLLAGEIETDALVKTDALQGTSFTARISNGANASANQNYAYSHPGEGAEWRPLARLEVLDANGSTVSHTCANGICDINWGLPGSTTPSNFNDDLLGHASIRIRGYDDINCVTNTTWIHARIMPKLKARHVSSRRYYGDPTVKINGQTKKVENYHAFKGDYVYEPLNQTGPTTISFRKRGALSVHEGAYDYDTSAANNVNATKVRIYGFNDEAALRLRSPLSAAISGTGVSCTGTTVADFACETTNCNSDGTCSFNFYANQNQEWGFVTFKWKAYLGDGTESRTYHWHPINTNPEDYLPNDWENHIPGETERHLYIRAVPIVTNPTFSTSPNEPLTLTLGRESLSYKGYNYPDAATFGANSGANGIQINVSNFRNGAATETVFDQTNYALTLKASPNYNFVGQMMFDYVVTVWGIASATGTAAVNVGSHLTANAVTFNTQSNTPLSGSIQKGIDFVKNAGFIEENPLDLQVVNEDLSLVPSAKGTVAIGTCTASGCPFTYTPPTAYTGTVNLKYRLKGGTLASPTWSNYAPLTIDVLPAPAKPVVYNLSLVGADETAKLIAISPGITSGYTDANGDKATKLHITSVTNGQITPSSPIDCDSSGLCLVSFTPDVGFYGNGSFSFNVEAGGEQALSPATVTVDFKPQLRVQNLTVNGSLNQPKAITIGRGTGYTYSPGAAVDTLLITGVTNGTISGSLTEIPCSSGSCALTFTPNTGFTGNASIQFRARISGTTNVESNIATITIAVAATDSAPVATDYTLNLASRNASLLQFELGKEYTDLEGDKASTLTLNSVLGGTTDTSSCNGTTGICSVNFTPNSNYFGQGRILYTVTANGKISNLGTITLVIPDDTARSYTLGWSAAPTLSDQCLVTIPSQITVRNGAQSCGTGNCVTPTIGTLSSAITSLAVTADLDSVDGQINLFSSLGRHLTSWEVSNGTETAKIGRFLELKSLGQPARARRPILTTVPAYDTAMEGVQSPYEGCIGSSCGSSKWSSVASGDGFSCALHADGRVFCWGSNAEGKLGRHESPGSTASSWDAKAIRDPLDPLSDLYGLTAVTAGKHHACALTASKRVVCWGSNEFGQLGANLPTGSGKAEDTPVYVRNTTNTANLGSIAAISAGDNHTCAVDTNRMVYCWGQNNHGQVGDGTRELTAIPKSVKIVTAKSASDEVLTTGDLTNIFSVSTGAAHSCAIRLTLSGSSVTAQNILCWGANDQNQIGDNDYYNNDASLLTRVSADASPVDRLYPVLVRNSANEALANPISVHTGGRTSCAVLASGVAQCWGSNTSGIAGVNDPSVNASVKNPTTIKSSNGIGDLTDIVTVAVGSNHACALLGTRKLVCWGENGTGQVGSGTQSSSHLPTTVRQAAATDLNPVFAVSLGANHSCLAASDGIRCFGANDSKQIGRENAAPSVSYAEDPVYLSDGAFDAARRSCSHRYDIIVP